LTDRKNLSQITSNYLRDAAAVVDAAADACSAKIVEAASVIAEAFSNDRKLMLCGNGGSAADSQHIATEFLSTLTSTFPRRSLPAIALTTDTSFLTAFANDFGYEDVFSRQVEGHGQAGDVLIGLSTSGNSENVLRAVTTATNKNIKTIGFVGELGGEIGDAVDIAVCAPSVVTSHIQEAHIAMAHALCYVVEDVVFGPDRPEWN
jgi:D-sedoheptulose 7-phosphate isomerase